MTPPAGYDISYYGQLNNVYLLLPLWYTYHTDDESGWLAIMNIVHPTTARTWIGTRMRGFWLMLMSAMAITGGCPCISFEGVKSDSHRVICRPPLVYAYPPTSYILRCYLSTWQGTADATCQVDRLVMIGNRHCRINVKFVKDIRACTTILPLDFPAGAR